MFSGFYFALREAGLPVSLNEWLTLTQALSLDLADNSLLEFYYLARSLLIKSETHYDRYDAVFADYFEDKAEPGETAGAGKSGAGKQGGQKPPDRSYNPDFFNPARYEVKQKDKPDQGADALAEARAKSAAEAAALPDPEAAAEAFAVPVAGETEDGAGGVNFGDRTGGMTAVNVAGARRYKDYRDDSIRHVRQYEVALRSLRQLSSRAAGPKDELNLEATVETTGANGGMLSLEWERPRKNTIKLILLMDSLGSIYYHFSAVAKLFQAAHRSVHFKEIKYYYFHNCVYGRVYKDQWLERKASVPTEEFFRQYNADCRLLIVGDARMSDRELMDVCGALDISAEYNHESGHTWLTRIAGHFPYAVWLNPVPVSLWAGGQGYASIKAIGEIFPMYELTPAGIAQAVKKLRSRSGLS